MRWDDLKVALALAREGAVGPASRALGVNVTTVYRRLDGLEAQLGQPLFDRQQGYALTAVGLEVLEHARAIEEETLALQRTVSGHDRQASGPVRVTLPESLLPLMLPLVWAFRAAHPRIVPTLETGDRMFDLQRREADVAIRPSATPPDDAVGRRIATIAWTLYRNANAPTDGGVTLDYTEALANVPAVGWWRAHPRRGEVALTLSTVPAMQTALCAGHGCGPLPCFVGDRTEGLVRACAPVPEAASSLWLLIHADLRRAARVRAFVDDLYPRLRGMAPVFEGTTS
ncbi:MAG: LysR family transcriptional regulator [Myxococcota bacterium]